MENSDGTVGLLGVADSFVEAFELVLDNVPKLYDTDTIRYCPSIDHVESVTAL